MCSSPDQISKRNFMTQFHLLEKVKSDVMLQQHHRLGARYVDGPLSEGSRLRLGVLARDTDRDRVSLTFSLRYFYVAKALMTNNYLRKTTR